MAQEKHLSHSQSLNAAISKPQPEYPAIAKQLKVEGTVELTAYVSEEGTVEKVETVSGNPILARSAQDALKKWKFNKSMEDGKPTKFVADVSFNFKL
jgi:protein TonB